MKLPPKITIADHFQDLEDQRVERTKGTKDLRSINLLEDACKTTTEILN